MPYSKTNWIPRTTPLSAENLNKMEEGIRQATEKIEEFDANKETLKKLSEQNGKLNYEGQPIETNIPNKDILEDLSDDQGKLKYKGQDISGGLDEEVVDTKFEDFAEDLADAIEDASLEPGEVPPVSRDLKVGDTVGNNAFEISDSDGNVVLAVTEEGHIKTREFDSENIIIPEVPQQNPVVVVGNPIGSATTQLTKLKIDNIIYSIPEGGSTGSSPSVNRGSFQGKKLMVSGDSITERNFRADILWHDYLKEWMGLAEVKNDGLSGSGLVKNNGLVYRLEQWNNKYNVQNMDIILYMGNMNDGTSGPTGSPDWVGQRTDPFENITQASASLYASLNYVCNQLITKYPNKPIGWIISNPRSQIASVDKGEDKSKQCWGTYDNSGKRCWFDEWVDIIKEVCGKYNIPVLDLYHESNVLRPWNSDNNREYFSCSASPNGDGIHPNTKGQKVMASIIYEWMFKYMLPNMDNTTPPETIPVTGITLSGDNTVLVGESITINASVMPVDATDKTVTWQTSSECITLIPGLEDFGQTCIVTAVSVGTAVLEATTRDGTYIDTITITIN